MLVTSTCSEMYMANSLELEEIFIYYLQPNAIHYGNSSQLSNKPKDPSRAYVCNLRFLAPERLWWWATMGLHCKMSHYLQAWELP